MTNPTPSSATSERSELVESGAHGLVGFPVEGRRRRKAPWLIIVAAVLIAAGVWLAVADPLVARGSSRSGVTDNPYPTSLQTVEKESISQETSVDATLGYAGSYSVVNQAQGTFTWLPTTGQVIGDGRVLYRVDGLPVVLLYGSTPAYRTLAEGASAADVTGWDVGELNADLLALGYANGSEIPAGSDEFSWWTKQAVEKLQAAVGVAQTGTLALGGVVFLPTAARITDVSATLGGPAGPGQTILRGTSTTREVTVALDAAQQSDVKAGDPVIITLPNRTTTPGVVSSVGTVATTPSGGGPNSSPTVMVEVTPADPAATGRVDQAPAEVSITTATIKDALVVPVNALIALSGGGYAVEVVNPGGVHGLVDVSLGIFDDADGLVQVHGSGLGAGQHVVVPTA
jgi:hypothetical protein